MQVVVKKPRIRIEGEINDELVEFLNSENDKEKVYAMQQIIVHADQINANKVAYDLYDVFRYH